MQKRIAQLPSSTFFSALTPNITAWMVLLICGFCAVSAPITALIPCLRGMGYGALASALLIRYPDIGAKYICVYLLPNLAVSTASLVFCCCEALKMSGYFWRMLTTTTNYRADKSAAPQFCGRMLLYLLIIIAGSILEAYMHKTLPAA